jgi:hypothetical protein
MTKPQTLNGWLSLFAKILGTALAALTAIKQVTDAGKGE